MAKVCSYKKNNNHIFNVIRLTMEMTDGTNDKTQWHRGKENVVRENRRRGRKMEVCK